MEQKLNGHSAEYIKRQAKRLKKELSIPHHEALDKAAEAAGFTNWRHFVNINAYLHTDLAPVNHKRVRIPRNGAIPVGTLIRFKPDKTLGIVFRSDSWSGTVEFYYEWGPGLAARHEVSICRDQSLLTQFKPMRLYLPYGKWTCKDGTEVLFNRDYRPLWAKDVNGVVIALDPDTWVEYEEEEWLYNDSTRPLENKRTFESCVAALREWGVENKRPVLLDLLPKAISSGNMEILKATKQGKIFPVAA